MTINDSCVVKEETKTEQCLPSPELSYMDTKKLTKIIPRNITLSKGAVDLIEKPITMKENKRLSRSEPKSLKKFKRKMKNRVRKKLRSVFI